MWLICLGDCLQWCSEIGGFGSIFGFVGEYQCVKSVAAITGVGELVKVGVKG